jgi:glutamate-1-semialdehyde 2,1-aminomutase
MLDLPETQSLYAGMDERWNRRAAQMNASLEAAGVPVRVANLTSIWTVLYTAPSRFNWMLQYYLREEGLLLSWVGTGRIIFSLNYTDADFDEVVDRFTRAALRMAANGWWWHAPEATNKSVRRGILRELIARRLGR